MNLKQKFNVIFFILVGILSTPIVITVTSTLANYLNFRVGYQYYRFTNLISMYLTLLVILPLSGISAFIATLFISPRDKKMSLEELSARKRVRAMAAITLVLEPILVILFPLIFFALGGSR